MAPTGTPRLRRTRVLMTAAGFASSALFLAIAVRRLDWTVVTRTLEQAELWPWLPAGIACYLAGQLVRGLRLRSLLRRDANLPLLTATNVVVVGYAVNNILPARAGELARSGMITERTGLPFAQSLTITFVERVLDGLAILALFFAASTVVTLQVTWLRVSLEASAAVFVIAALAIAAAVAWPGVVMTVASRLSARLPLPLQRLALRMMTGFTRGAGAVGDVRRAARLGMLSVLVWTLEAGLFLFLLPAMALPFAPTWAIVAMAVTNLGLLVPSSPGFIGPFHFFCMQTVVALGAESTRAFAYAVLVHAAFYVPVTAWGLLALLRYGVELASLKSVTRAVRNLKGSDVPAASPGIMAAAAPAVVVTALPREAPAGPLPLAPLLAGVVDAFLPWDVRAADTASSLGATAPEERSAIARDAADFVAGQIRALPRRFQLMFVVGLAGFALSVRLRHPRGFLALPRARRVAIVESWAFGGWGLGRSLFRPVRSTALIAFYDHPAVRDRVAPAVPEPAPAVVVGGPR